jgi:TM2 domain-containing membrane protein YozV
MIGILLSIIIPGLGQLYFGKTLRGVIMILLAITPLYPAALVWSIVDAVNLNKKIKPDPIMKKEAIIIIIWAFIIIPLGLFGSVFGTFTLFSKISDKFFLPNSTRLEMEEIVLTLENYKKSYEIYPNTLDEIIGKYPIRQNWIADAWCQQYYYNSIKEGTGYKLISKGADHKLNTKDDIIFTSE